MQNLLILLTFSLMINGNSSANNGKNHCAHNDSAIHKTVAENGVDIAGNEIDSLAYLFSNPPLDCRPNVFWDWMGGMISKEGIQKDLEALAAQGVGGVMVMQMPDQVTDGPPITLNDYKGKVKCLSDEWFDMVNYAIGQTDKLGMTFSIFFTPGWSHAGGPWVKPEKGLKKLQTTQVEVTGPIQLDTVLPRDARLTGAGVGKGVNRGPYFYRDISVVAYPSKDHLVASAHDIINVTNRMDSNGRFTWNVPEGSWTIVRMGITSENSVNHPAPPEGTGLECDRMDTAAVRIVFDGAIKRIVEEARAKRYHSFKAFETDSYEGGYQDFSIDFIEQFKRRRGYDCTVWIPAFADQNLIIESKDLTRRFRYDMSLTIGELIAERFHGQLRKIADEYKIGWMTEPYFLMPIDWRMAGAYSKMPGSEIWVGGGEPKKAPAELQTNSWATMLTTGQFIGAAPDIAALYGLQNVWAEAFTAESYNSAWRNDPYALKPWGDAAFCRGINEIYMHGFTLNPFDDKFQPGVSMGFWGTQMNRNTTWWAYATPWHLYLSRCAYMLRQGRPVNDILAYPSKIEPISSMSVNAGSFRQTVMNDDVLFCRIGVKDRHIIVMGGANFSALTLTPDVALSPGSLRKILELVNEGATLIAKQPLSTAPGLENYPACDKEVAALELEIWGGKSSGIYNEHVLGKGRVYGTDSIVAVMKKITGGPDVQFNVKSEGDKEHLDFTHRHSPDADIYFICNTGDHAVEADVDFRITGLNPELWNPVSGKAESFKNYSVKNGYTTVSIQFNPRQSFFIIFRNNKLSSLTTASSNPPILLTALNGPWDLNFNPNWGGPAKVSFPELQDWSTRRETGIKYYSGTATYTKIFSMPLVLSKHEYYLNLGVVHNIAHVNLNGEDLGIVWCAPWQIATPAGLFKNTGNKLTIKVTNTWVNRLIGDEQLPDDCELVSWNPDPKNAGDFMRKGSYDVNMGSHRIKYLPDWLTGSSMGRPSTGRYTLSTWRFYNTKAPLLPAGLIGPVTITQK